MNTYKNKVLALLRLKKDEYEQLRRHHSYYPERYFQQTECDARIKAYEELMAELEKDDKP